MASSSGSAAPGDVSECSPRLAGARRKLPANGAAAAASAAGKRAKRQQLPRKKVVVQLDSSLWSWVVLAGFHFAEKYKALKRDTVVRFEIGVQPTIQVSVDGKLAARGELPVLQWLFLHTNLYGRRRAKAWVQDAIEKLLPEVQKQRDAGWTTIPPSMLRLEQGLQRDREFVALPWITMADIVWYAFSADIFVHTPEILLRAHLSKTIDWMGVMQRALLHVLSPTTQKVIEVSCSKDNAPVPRALLGISTPPRVPWLSCDGATQLTLGDFAPPDRNGQCVKRACRIARSADTVQKPADNKRDRRVVATNFSAVQEKLQAGGLGLALSDLAPSEIAAHRIAWESLPRMLDPYNMMREGRAKRKRQQAQCMVSLVLPLLRTGGHFVEFAAGSGCIGLLVAAMRPDCKVTLVDLNPVSLGYAEANAASASLRNVTIRCCDIRDYDVSDFDVGLALHACGAASDFALHKCLISRAAFVIAPCCAGNLQNCHACESKTANPKSSIDDLYTSAEFPASERMRKAGITRDEFLAIARAADHSSTLEHAAKGHRAMTILDMDRCYLAEQQGYSASYRRMVPPSCTPKNHVVVGRLAIKD